MTRPIMFSDAAVIEARIENGTLNSNDAQQALNDLEVLYSKGLVSASKKRELQIKLKSLL